MRLTNRGLQTNLFYTPTLMDQKQILFQTERTLSFKIIALSTYNHSGKIAIPKGGYVFAIGPYAKSLIIPLILGSLATVNIEIIPHFAKKEHYLAWQMVDNVLGGSPILLYHGKIVQDHSMERLRSPFITDRYAHTRRWCFKEWTLAICCCRTKCADG